jgi:hypothetical protein
MTKNIKVDDKNWKELTLLKMELSHKNTNQTISYLLYEISKPDFTESDRTQTKQFARKQVTKKEGEDSETRISPLNTSNQIKGGANK